MRNTKKIRSMRGAMLAYVIGSTFFMAVAGVGIIVLLMLFGGSREGTNANDAGTLNVGKCAPKIQVPASAAELQIFGALAENGNQFSLKSINSVNAHAMLTLLNQRSMEMTGTSSAASKANAIREINAANAISSRLATALNRQQNLEPRFETVAQEHAIRMLDNRHQLEPIANTWDTSLMNRGTESNLRFRQSQLPPGITLPMLGNPVLKQADGRFYFKGYTPIPAWGDRFINFVPFEFKQTPHLVSLKNFEADMLSRKPYPQWQNPVPNSFHSRSQTRDLSNRVHVFNSAAISNIMTREDVELQNGFVRISLGDDTVKWFPSGIHTDTDILFNKLQPSVHKGHLDDPLMPGSWWDVTLNYGAQYRDADGRNTLYKAVYALGGDTDDMYIGLNKLLLNRLNQIKPGTTWAQVVALLRTKTITGGRDRFVIGRDKSGALMIANEANGSEVAQLETWTAQAVQNGAHADGGMIKAQKQEDPSPNNFGNVFHVMVGPWGLVYKPWIGFTTWRHEVDIRPGTGVNGALLDISQRDLTAAYFNSLGGCCWP